MAEHDTGRREHRRVAVAGAAALAMLAAGAVAGCGGGGGGGASPSTPAPGGPPAGGAGQAADQAEFGLSGREIEARQVKVEGLVRSCMKGQGFEYVPVDPATLRAAMDSNSKPTGISAREFVKQYGYGITTLYEAQLKQAQNGQGEPNKKIRAGLAPADRTAYDRALYGDNPSATFAAALDSEDLTGLGGCTKQAVDAVFPPDEVRRLTGANSQNAVGDRALQDPRVVEATKAWSACMRAGGRTFAKPDDIAVDLQGKLAAIVGAAPKTAPIGATAPPYDRAALAVLQREEVAVATADAACAAKGLKAIKDKVEAELTKAIGG